MKTILALLMFSSVSMAKETWSCTDEAGSLKGSSYYACGIGEAMSESQARRFAMNNAKDEFNSFCRDSSNCHGHKLTIEPKRMTCEETKGFYKCYRMVVFTILDSKLSGWDIDDKIAQKDEDRDNIR